MFFCWRPYFLILIIGSVINGSSKLMFVGFNSLLALPLWEVSPVKNVTQSESSFIELNCLAEGVPKPLIQWSFNGVPLHELIQTDRRLLLNDGRILRISHLNHDIDSGFYECRAFNFLGNISATIFLNVLAFAPQFKMAENRLWKLIYKSTVNLDCDVEAAPAPSVHWVDANDTAIVGKPNKIELFPNNTLRIKNLDFEDQGFYYCNVSNKYGINRALNKIEVFSKNYILSKRV